MKATSSRRPRRWLAGLLAAAVLVAAGPPALAAEERDDLGYYRMLDEAGREVFVTGIITRVGDQFITADNRRYEVTAVDGDEARVRFLGIEDLTLTPDEEAAALAQVPAAFTGASVRERLAAFWVRLRDPSRRVQAQTRSVCVYFTHNGESYEPSDGEANTEGRGGIYEVGQSLQAALERAGIRVVRDDSIHLPHDQLAYDRSRRTALRCARQARAAALVDVHRDTAPPQAYETTIQGQPVTQVMLVVGRQNPAMQANLAFAKRLKARVDEEFPGLVRGIFMARGKYNQDLHPRAILLEVGAHKNRREDAERGVALFGQAVAPVLAAAGGGEARSGWQALLWILVLLAVGGGLYLWISAGSWQEAVRKVRQFVTTEFADVFGRLRPRGGGRS